MYNLNVSMGAPPLLGVGPMAVSCTTPRTPEILNSVIAMTNPMEIYQHQVQQTQQQQQQLPPANRVSSVIDSETGHAKQQQQTTQFASDNQFPQILTTEPSAGSNSDSSAAVTPTGENESSTPSVTKTRSLLIKYGLKLTIESKRKQSVGDSSGNETSKSNRKDTVTSMDTSDDDDDDDDEDQNSPKNGLTPEDEERRRRRRERNKIAATKCRMKKRERTLNLVTESEILEKQNIDLKDLERKLEKERRELLEALQQHSKMCVVPGGYQAPVPPSRHSGCCGGTSVTIKTEPVGSSTPTSGRGRRGGTGRGRGRGGGGRGGVGSRKVKQEPIRSPLQPDKSVLPNIMSSIQLPHFQANPNNNNNNINNHNNNNTSSSTNGTALDPFYPKYNAMDESPSVDYYNYDGTLASVADAVSINNNCANYLLKSPTTSVDSLSTSVALNDLSNSSSFSYPMATPVHPMNGFNGNGLHLRPSPLIKNDIYIPNCENSNDLLQCSPNMLSNHQMQNSDLYMDQDTETKLHEMTLNGNGNNLSCYDDAPLFSVFC